MVSTHGKGASHVHLPLRIGGWGSSGLYDWGIFLPERRRLAGTHLFFIWPNSDYHCPLDLVVFWQRRNGSIYLSRRGYFNLCIILNSNTDFCFLKLFFVRLTYHWSRRYLGSGYIQTHFKWIDLIFEYRLILIFSQAMRFTTRLVLTNFLV